MEYFTSQADYWHDIESTFDPDGPVVHLIDYHSYTSIYHQDLLDWDARDERGETPLDSAALNAMAYPDDDTVPLYELYKSRVLPQGTQLVDRCRLADDAAEEVVDLTSTSLI